MNPTPRTESVPLTQRPAQLLAGLVGVALLLLGGVPLTERLFAHLTVWAAGQTIPGLSHLVLLVVGAALLTLFWRLRHGKAPAAQDR
ncbi:hypothetical protein [Actinacidiphila glaucinigra]|uniref:Uncharacterized protein n=1 Tax=Actinacidiphila glaucinigra TaxID=235986 RepID=A0A239N6K8_9ACTN|nr:hypothetical protein [Actinacidiphila glaucinigra]SNT50647.1 hypothetical protein SAMN05216252_13233 [Actinacidiphila glaucinigra]